MIKNQQLAHAMALFKHGNFSRAARFSSISQPAFSRSILSLENKLGVKLFDREGHEVTPTVYGEVLLRRAKGILEESEELEREIQLMQGLEVGRFGVALGSYPAELSGNRALGRMVLEHPDIRTSIILSDWRNVTSHVLSKSVDLGFAEISVAKGDERLQTQLVGQHDLVLYCRGNHPLAKQEKVTRAELNQYPLVTVRLPERMVKVFPGKSHIDQDTGHLIPSVEVADLNTARSIVAGSNAIAATTPLQIEDQLRSGKLRVLPYWGPWLSLNYGFIFLRNRTISPATELFMHLIAQIEEEIRPRNQAFIQEIFSSMGITKSRS